MNEERKGIETNLHGWRMRQMQSEKDMYFLNKRKAEIDSMIEVWTERLAEYIENKTNGTVIKIEGKTITPWICNKCSWHNSEIDEQCRNKICDNTKTKQTEQVNKK